MSFPWQHGGDGDAQTFPWQQRASHGAEAPPERADAAEHEAPAADPERTEPARAATRGDDASAAGDDGRSEPPAAHAPRHERPTPADRRAERERRTARPPKAPRRTPRPTPPDATAGASRRPRRVPVARVAGIVTLGAVALVIAGGIGASIVAVLAPAPAEGRAAPTLIAATAEEVALDVATRYVDALAAGDAEAALALVDVNDAASLALATDEMLDALSDDVRFDDAEIAVERSDEWALPVATVTVAAGEEQFSFPLEIEADPASPEASRITSGLPLLTFGTGYEGLDITVNGIAADSSTAAIYGVFPGLYRIGTDTPHFRIAGEPVEATTDFAYVYSNERVPELDDEGVAAFRSAVRASAEACLASTSLDAGCGLGVTSAVSGDATLVDGTVMRTISDEAWAEIDAMEPSPGSESVLAQRGEHVGSVTFVADWTSPTLGSGREEIYGGPWLGTPTVDFGDPELPVSWD